MFFRIEPSSPVPIYRQLIEQIRLAVASGRLQPDERLPSVRELADELQINLQTAVKAYNELVREGVLEMRRGLGTYVPLKPKLPSDGTAKARVTEEVRRVCRVAYAYGMSTEDLIKLIRKTWLEESKQ